jgi:hypothetical protein
MKTRDSEVVIKKQRDEIKSLKALLVEVQKKHLYEPNSDHHEYCPGCHRSPYNVPPHDPECLVPRLAKALR